MTVLMNNAFANVRKQPKASSVPPDVRLHYLGRAAFILQFGSGISVLTDYDVSEASNPEYPLYTFKDIQLDIATCSYQDLDCHRPDLYPDVVHVLTRASFEGSESLSFNGVKITQLLANEQANQESVGFIFAYRGQTIVHAGNILNEIRLLREQTIQRYFKRIFPHFIDLLLLPIGRSNEIFDTLAFFIALLRPRRVIPMQYAPPQIKKDFLDFLGEQNAKGGTQYQLEQTQGAQYTLASGANVGSSIMVNSLNPQPFSCDTNR